MAKESAARAVKRRKGHGWTKRRLPKSWPARAILEEDRTRYLIEWEPVGSGAECEQKWELKHYANAALVADWEGRKRASLRRKRNSEQGDVSTLESEHKGRVHDHRDMEFRGRSGQTTTSSLSPTEHGVGSGNEQRLSADNSGLIEMHSSGELWTSAVSDPLETTSAAPLELTNCSPLKTSGGAAHMLDGHGTKGFDDLSLTMTNHPDQECGLSHVKTRAALQEIVQDENRGEIIEARYGTVAVVGLEGSQSRHNQIALSKGPHLGELASSQQLRMAAREDSAYVPLADSYWELCSSSIEASTAHVSQSYSDHKPSKVACGVQS